MLNGSQSGQLNAVSSEPDFAASRDFVSILKGSTPTFALLLDGRSREIDLRKMVSEASNVYKCRVERDSISPYGVRLTSFVIHYPRAVLAEVVTHRMVSDAWGDSEVSWCERTKTKDVSKNSASSRAIPFAKMVSKVQAEPYMPQWTLNQKGMQGGDCSDESTVVIANSVWLQARNEAIFRAEQLSSLGIHKQDCNRLLEPWAWITQIVTATEWDNFFALRCHKDAHPAFQRIARMMFLELRKSIPDKLAWGQWHLPFVPREQALSLIWKPALESNVPYLLPDLLKFSMARCGWLSYENHDKDGTPEQMLRTFDRFVSGDLMHGSVAEHQGTPEGPFMKLLTDPYRSNLRGWIQARKLIPREKVTSYNPSDEEIASWGLSTP